MTKKELLAEAKRRYPVGTVITQANTSIPFDPQHYNSIKFIVNDDFSNDLNSWLTNEHVIAYCKDALGRKITGRGIYLYYKGNWAEIISTPNKVIEIW